MTPGDRTRSVLGAATALVLAAGVAVGCSSGGSDDREISHPTVTPGDAPLLTGAPDPHRVPPPQWSAGLDGPNPLERFAQTPYNSDGAPPPKVVDAPDVPGRRAIEFAVPGGGQRSELEPGVPVYREGDEAWFGFAEFLPTSFPVDAAGWQVVAQWKNAGEGSPPLEIKIDHGRYVLDGGAGPDPDDYFSTPIGAARAGQQTNLVVHVRFSTDPKKALVDVWENGQQRLAGYRPPGGTRYANDDSYLKTGLYRDTGIHEDGRIYLVDARVAQSYDSAAALVVPPTR